MAKKESEAKAKKEVKIVKHANVKKSKKNVPKGYMYISSTFNNTICSITDTEGNVIANSSGGVVGFKGTRKKTPYAASKASEDVINKAIKMGLKEVDIFLKGAGPGRQLAVKAVRTSGIKVLSLVDATKIPHNGCRPKKKPRKS